MDETESLLAVFATPGLEWMSDHTWAPETAHADITRALSAFDPALLAVEYFMLAQMWAQDLIAEQMVRRPGVFEQCHPPHIAQDPLALLCTARYLRNTMHKVRGGSTFRYHLDWLVELGVSIPADSMEVSFLLQCIDHRAPDEPRVEWLLRTLTCMQSLAETISPDLVYMSCFFFKDCDVKSPVCVEICGLWLALVHGNPGIPSRAKTDLAVAVFSDHDVMELGSVDILEQYCPSALPHWPIISGLGLDIRQACTLVFKPTAPGIALPPMDAP
jgi:hypothetical protein